MTQFRQQLEGELENLYESYKKRTADEFSAHVDATNLRSKTEITNKFISSLDDELKKEISPAEFRAKYFENYKKCLLEVRFNSKHLIFLKKILSQNQFQDENEKDRWR